MTRPRAADDRRRLGRLGRAALRALAACPLQAEPAEVGPAQAQARIGFEDATERAGLGGIDERTCGASFGDHDGDGWPDLWVGNHQDAPRFLRNRGDGSFEDVTARLFKAPLDGDTHGAAWADLDGDGRRELVELCGAQHGRGGIPSRLYVNRDGVLVDAAAELGVAAAESRGRTPLWLDWNGDGALDLLSANKVRRDDDGPTTLFVRDAAAGVFRAGAEFPRQSMGGNEAFALLADFTGAPPLSMVLVVADDVEVLPVGVEPPASAASPRGRRRREEARARAPKRAGDGALLPDAALAGRVCDAAACDLDGDLRADLVLVRPGFDAGDEVSATPERIAASLHITLLDESKLLAFRADGPVEVELCAEQAGLPIFCGADLTPRQRRVLQIDARQPRFHLPEEIPEFARGALVGWNVAKERFEIHAKFNGFLRLDLEVRGTGLELDESRLVTEGMEARPSTLLLSGSKFAELPLDDSLSDASSVAAGDFDNDADVDLYVVCRGRIANRANRLYENLGGGRFRSVPDAGGAAGSMRGRGDAVAMADYDRDGFLDLFVANGEGADPFNLGPYQLFRNRGNGNHWLELDLHGTVSNFEGIGARVLATAGGVTQARLQGGGIHSFSQDHSRIHFGLGAATVVERLVIRWPSGIEQVLEGVAADQVLAVREPAPDRDRAGADGDE